MPKQHDHTAATEASYQQDISTHLRRNYLVLLGHGMLGMTGFRLLNAPTFLPAYIYLLSGSELMVGLAMAAQHLGGAIASIPGGNIIAHRKRVMPVFMTVGALMRLQVLGISLSGYFLTGSAALAATILFLGLFGLMNGMQSVAFQYTLTKLIPVNVRGRLTGFRTLMAGIISSAIAMLGGSYFIEHNVWGNGYSTTFLLAFILTALGLLVLVGIREPEPPTMRARSTLGGHLRELPAILRGHRDAAIFILVRSAASAAVAAVPFYILYAGDNTTLSGADLGYLTAAFLLMQTVTNFGWGALADKTGNKLVFVLALGIWGLSVLLLLLSTSFVWLLVAFAGVGIGLGGYHIGGMNLLLEFGTREELPTLIAVGNAATSLMFAVGPVLGGLFLQTGDYVDLFWIAIGIKVVAVTALIFAVREPRHTAL